MSEKEIITGGPTIDETVTAEAGVEQVPSEARDNDGNFTEYEPIKRYFKGDTVYRVVNPGGEVNLPEGAVSATDALEAGESTNPQLKLNVELDEDGNIAEAPADQLHHITPADAQPEADFTNEPEFVATESPVVEGERGENEDEAVG